MGFEGPGGRKSLCGPQSSHLKYFGVEHACVSVPAPQTRGSVSKPCIVGRVPGVKINGSRAWWGPGKWVLGGRRKFLLLGLGAGSQGVKCGEVGTGQVREKDSRECQHPASAGGWWAEAVSPSGAHLGAHSQGGSSPNPRGCFLSFSFLEQVVSYLTCGWHVCTYLQG